MTWSMQLLWGKMESRKKQKESWRNASNAWSSCAALWRSWQTWRRWACSRIWAVQPRPKNMFPIVSSMFFHITKCYEPECPEAFCKHHQGPERCAALIFSACEWQSGLCQMPLVQGLHNLCLASVVSVLFSLETAQQRNNLGSKDIESMKHIYI